MKRLTFIFIIVFCKILFAIAVSPDSLMQAGDRNYDNFQMDRALELYKKAYSQMGDKYPIVLRLTKCYNNIGEDKASEEFYIKAHNYAEKLMEIDSLRAQSHIYVAMTLGNLALYKGGKEKVKMSNEIVHHAKRAIKLDPTLVHPYVILGIYYREVAGLNFFLKTFARTFYGEVPDVGYEDAEAMFKKAIERYPELINPRYHLAKTYEKQSKDEKAIKQYRQILQLEPKDHDDFRKIDIAKDKIGNPDN